MSDILRYCVAHETWEDGLPFLCDCFCGADFGGNPDNIKKRIRYDIQTLKLRGEQ